MSIELEYLEELSLAIDRGVVSYACQGVHNNEWCISNTLQEIEEKAQRAANSFKYGVSIYRLINKLDTVGEDYYLVVRKILEPGPKGEPHLQWSLVGTREAAEMMRDVSLGPTPYFGATVEKVIEPRGSEPKRSVK